MSKGGSGRGIRTPDLRVMSPTSYRCSIPRHWPRPRAPGGAATGGSDLPSHGVAPAVLSALGRFTTVFGMGTGGSTPLQPPLVAAPPGPRVGPEGTGGVVWGGLPRLLVAAGGVDRVERSALRTAPLHGLPRLHVRPITWSSPRGLRRLVRPGASSWGGLRA